MRCNICFVLVDHVSFGTEAGCVLTLGEGDTGQLGLGPDVMERTKPGLVSIEDPVIQICAGGMHTVCLTDKHQVSVLKHMLTLSPRHRYISKLKVIFFGQKMLFRIREVSPHHKFTAL